MLKQVTALMLGGSLLLSPLAGCENLPGDRGTQGAVIGGAAGGLAGAAIARDNRLLGALIGAAIGAGGGYIIGTQTEKVDADEDARQEARRAGRRAQDDPATAQDALESDTADLNDDGFVTMDEVVAMSDAGFTDGEMLRRLEATDQVFELTADQQDYLIDQGLSRNFVNQINQVNQAERQRILQEIEQREDVRQDVIGQPAQ